PSEPASSRFPVLVTAVTSAPKALASWTAKLPTPPLAPLIRTVWPGWSSPWWRRPWGAVVAAIGTAAASSNDRLAGLDETKPTGAATEAAKPPEAVARRCAAGLSPGAGAVSGEPAVAVVQEVGVDLVAGLEPGDAAADRLHPPGDVDAEDLVLG